MFKEGKKAEKKLLSLQFLIFILGSQKKKKKKKLITLYVFKMNTGLHVNIYF